MWDLAQALLAAVGNQIDDNTPDIEDIDRRFVTAGQDQVTRDPCPSLSVRWASNERGTATEVNVEPHLQASPLWVATFVVEIVRCWPTSADTIDEDDIETAAQKMLRDAWLLSEGVARATTDEEWQDFCANTFLGPVLPDARPEGMAHAVSLTVRAEIVGTGGAPGS